MATAKEVFAEEGIEVEFEIGTMIETPRAALTANRIASEAEYFSFGTRGYVSDYTLLLRTNASPLKLQEIASYRKIVHKLLASN